ncbi:c-type cytochrome biogenesis protein CcmI [Glaciecola siphonariae]|uniref:C-type cytochrome biogenesis protein CcmI n=1 Tax=Glaciecola siphonariae TaxID=521012 RepID=A0ABV9LU96_9ALTE
MTQFYIYGAVLIMLSLLFVFIPLLRKAKRNRLQLTNANVVKQRIAELEREVEEGLISEKDKLSAVRELKLALVEETYDVADMSIDDAAGSKINWLVLATLTLPAVLVGVWVYHSANQLDGLEEYIAAQTQAADLTARIQGQNGAQVTPNDYANFALVIRERLRKTPEDVEGWRLLGQVQMAIGRMEESVAAFEKALDLDPRNEELRERYAQALMASGTEDTLQNAKRQVQYLLTLSPNNRDYRLLLTVVATQLGEAELAAQNFLMISNELSPSSNFYQSLVAQLVNIGVSRERITGTSLPASSADNEMQSANAAAPSSSDNAYGDQANSGDEQTGVSVEISLADSLRSKLPSAGFLIVFAQNAQAESRMPLAVKRLPLNGFPIRVELSDNDAMMPGMTLSSADTVRIVARVSADADVMPSQGELQGEIDSITLIKGQVQTRQIQINKELM